MLICLALSASAAAGVPATAPDWSEADIRASKIETPGAALLPAKPRWRANPMNLLVVVEGGDHHVSLVDGDRFETVHRFPSRFALRGRPKFTPDGRFVYLGSRDGWITKYDLWNLTVVAEVRAGISMSNLTLSGDGRWVMAANDLPNTLVLFDADLKLVRSYVVTRLDRKITSRVSAVYDATPRKSFIVALKDLAELWEISYDEKAAPIYDGLVHDYQMGEGLAKAGYLGIRRTPLDEPLDDFLFDQNYRNVIGTTLPKGNGSSSAQVVNLDVRRRIASFPLSGTPQPGSGITFPWNGTTVLATPNLKDGTVMLVDMKTWQVIKTIPTLEPVAQVHQPGGVEFTRDGRYALASLAEMDGALIVYEARTFKEIKRLFMSNPIGKYSVWNEISRSEGASH